MVYDGKIPAGTSESAMAQALIDAGADPDFDMGHPMMAAVSYNAINVVRALLDGGAAVDGVDGDGLPMAYAVHFGHPHIIALLVERGAKLDLRFAAGAGDLQAIKRFINPDGSLKPGAGDLADPYTHKDKKRGKGVHRMERTRENILLQAFYFACQGAQYECAEFLLEQGIDINAYVPGLDSDAPTLHHCCWLNWHGKGEDSKVRAPRYLKTVRFLLEHGAHPNLPNKYGARALAYANFRSTAEIRSLLKAYGAE